jgi:sirohydrochlorin cobaltochelatase
LNVPVMVAPYLGVHPYLIEVAAQRVQELVEGTATMTCDLCKYRQPMAGYEDQMGQTQTTHHLYGGSAHHHDHDHHHHDHHDHHHDHHH